MSIYEYKTQFQNLLRPISNALAENGVSANQVTVSAVALSIGTAWVIAKPAQDKQAYWFVLPASLFGRMALNAIDGMIAKEHNQQTQLGAVLNEAGDIVSDVALISAFSAHIKSTHSSHLAKNLITRLSGDFSDSQWMTSLTALTLSTELVAIAGSAVQERTNHGPLGKSDRAFEMGVLSLLAGLGVNLLPYRHWLYMGNAFLLNKTLYNRIISVASQVFHRQHPAPVATLEHTEITTHINKKQSKKQITHQGQTMNQDVSKHLLTDSNTSETPINVYTGENSFNAYDGTAIFYRYWLTKPLDKLKRSKSKQDKKQVILLHRGHEHSGRLSALADYFVQAGYQVFAWDARGNGRSGGEKDHADSFTQLARDLDDFAKLVCTTSGIALEDTILVSSSIGALLAATWVHDYAPNIRGMVLATPAFAIRLYVPFAIPSLKLAGKLGMMSRVSSYVKSQVLTHDKAAQKRYDSDPLISGSISRDFLVDTHMTGQRLLDDAGAITTPTLVICAGKDYVVDKSVERQFYDNISSPTKHWKFYPDSFHAIFHETNKADVYADCLAFAEQLFATPHETYDHTQAHLESYSKDRVERMSINGFNPNFALTRFMINKFGRVSAAISTGLDHGFDSGSSLEHVYQNAPAGKSFIGKQIDAFYLNNIGWQGIRIRKQHLIELAEQALAQRLADQNDNDTRILDIASGNGFYIFELLEKHPHLAAELRDYAEHNIKVLSEKAQAHAQHFHLDTQNNKITACLTDAFNAQSYPDADQFDLAVASGVFELFSDNTLVQTAIAGIHHQLKEGGYFLYTNQPWHPEQEFIGKTLNNHRGKDWIMRCRPQAEIDQLVAQAGFIKRDMRIDRFGIFTVSLAQKVSQ